MNATPPPAREPRLALAGLTKRFGSLVACDDLTFSADAGTIHGVIGENGAGKSTAMKMIYGLLRPDAGEIRIDGKSCQFKSPAAAIRAGVGMVHQHFMLAGPHTGLDNILLGAEPGNIFRIARDRARAELLERSRRHGISVNLDDPVCKMPVGVQQRLEILKLLYRRAEILIFDEPTAVLTPQETNDLFSAFKSLKAEGKTILLVTHKLREIMAITDEVTVLRAGRIVATYRTCETSPGELAEQMIGKKPAPCISVGDKTSAKPGPLKISNLSLAGKNARNVLSDINLEVAAGEIIGVAGIEGNGQSELIRAIMGRHDEALELSGEIVLLGQKVTGLQPAAIRDRGVALIPEDRQHEGLLLNRPLTENFLLGRQRGREFSSRGILKISHTRTATNEAIQRFGIRAQNAMVPARNLSGGNQQKLIVARELGRKPNLIIAAQPTRGVDLGAGQMIHTELIEAAKRGAGVLLISSDLDEILSLSHRIVVMTNGHIAAEYPRGTVTEQELGLKMAGA